MAGVRFSVTANAISLSAATVKTLQQILAASNHRVLVTAISVSFNGTTPTNTPVLVEVLVQSTAGTGTTNNPVKKNAGDDETLAVTGLKAHTAEPTAGNILFSDYVHPQAGKPFVIPFDGPLVVVGGQRLGVRATAPDAVSAAVTIQGEE